MGSIIVSARDITDYDIENHIIWFNPVAWNRLDFDSKIRAIQTAVKGFPARLYGYWEVKEMGSGLKLATFKLTGSGAENIKILVN